MAWSSVIKVLLICALIAGTLFVRQPDAAQVKPTAENLLNHATCSDLNATAHRHLKNAIILFQRWVRAVENATRNKSPTASIPVSEEVKQLTAEMLGLIPILKETILKAAVCAIDQAAALDELVARLFKDCVEPAAKIRNTTEKALNATIEQLALSRNLQADDAESERVARRNVVQLENSGFAFADVLAIWNDEQAGLLVKAAKLAFTVCSAVASAVVTGFSALIVYASPAAKELFALTVNQTIIAAERLSIDDSAVANATEAVRVAAADAVSASDSHHFFLDAYNEARSRQLLNHAAAESAKNWQHDANKFVALVEALMSDVQAYGDRYPSLDGIRAQLDEIYRSRVFVALATRPGTEVEAGPGEGVAETAVQWRARMIAVWQNCTTLY